MNIYEEGTNYTDVMLHTITPLNIVLLDTYFSNLIVGLYVYII